MIDNNQAKILITGSGSFVGKGYRKYSSHIKIDEVSVRSSIPNVDFLHEYNVVIHLAAIVHQSSMIPESEYMRVNRDITLKVAENAKIAGVEQFVFLSSLKVYGDYGNNDQLICEDAACHPDDSYGKSKLEAENGLLALQDVNFKVSIVRSPLVYGEGVKANMLSLLKLVRKFPIIPLGKIKNKRDFIFIGNLAAYIDRIIQQHLSGIFLVKDSESLSTSELVKQIAVSMNRKVLLLHIPVFLYPVLEFVFPKSFTMLFGSVNFDNRYTQKKLYIDPPYTTEEGIRRMTTYYLENQA